MKHVLIVTVAVILIGGMTACGGDDDLIEGAKSHGKQIGEKECECRNAPPEESGDCTEELLSLIKNYEAFASTDEMKEKSKEIEKAYNEAYKEALKSCE